MSAVARLPALVLLAAGACAALVAWPARANDAPPQADSMNPASYPQLALQSSAPVAMAAVVPSGAGLPSATDGTPRLPAATPPQDTTLPAAEALEAADRVVVRKGERKLYLMRNGRVLRTYPVRLGLSPQGPKEREGDFRTPEGSYTLSARNPQSDFFLSIQVSYPNAQDAAAARRAGVRTGGSIMIHGLPNVPKRSMEYYRNVDWTNGCIAVSNDDMLEIWLLTSQHTPIDIEP